MVVVNTSSGSTRVYDLRDEESLPDLLLLLSSNQVTALSILHDGMQHVLPQPKKFRAKPNFGVELVSNGDNSSLIAERIYSQVGDVRVSVTRTFASKLVRTDLVRIGKQLYNPLSRG